MSQFQSISWKKEAVIYATSLTQVLYSLALKNLTGSVSVITNPPSLPQSLFIGNLLRVGYSLNSLL